MAFNRNMLIAGLLTLSAGVQACVPPGSGSKIGAAVAYYSDEACTKLIDTTCYIIPDKHYTSGEHVCEGISPITEVGHLFGKLVGTPYSGNVQMVYSNTKECPKGGPGDVDAVIVDNNSCVKITSHASGAGVAIYPVGGSPDQVTGPADKRDAAMEMSETDAQVKEREHARAFKRDELAYHRNLKRTTRKCHGFVKTSSAPYDTPSYQISPIVDCTGSPQPCQIALSHSDSHTETSMYQATAGFDIAGIMASVTFGQSFSNSETTSTTITLYVPKGQKGFASAYCAAEKFEGHFTGCSGPDKNIPGHVIALKKDGYTYKEINTGA